MRRGRSKVGSRTEEWINAITHGFGAVMALIGLVVLIVVAGSYGGFWHLLSGAIYGGSLVLLYLASTLYHSFTNEKRRALFKFLDHAAIYVLIAGNYTPFALIPLHGTLGWSVFCIIWGLAIAGIVFQFFFVKRFKVLSTLCYVLMGWFAAFIIKPLLDTLPLEAVYWMVAGGVCYTVGAGFYLAKRLPYNHAVWHVFVLAGSAIHFFTVVSYVLPISI